MSLVLRDGVRTPASRSSTPPVHPELGPLVDARLAGRPPIGEDDVRRRRAPARRVGRRPPDAARGPSATPRGSRRVDRARRIRAGRAAAPSFAHASEAELARILDFYEVRWAYEPDTFPIGWNLDGDVIESFSPDFYLPDLDLYVELTTLKQKLVRKKNRKLRRLRELYPDVQHQAVLRARLPGAPAQVRAHGARRRAHRDDRPGHAAARRRRGRGRGRGRGRRSRHRGAAGRPGGATAELAAELVVPAAPPAATPGRDPRDRGPRRGRRLGARRRNRSGSAPRTPPPAAGRVTPVTAAMRAGRRGAMIDTIPRDRRHRRATHDPHR